MDDAIGIYRRDPQRRQPSTTAATLSSWRNLAASKLLKEGSHLRRLQQHEHGIPVAGWQLSSKKAAIYDGCNASAGTSCTRPVRTPQRRQPSTTAATTGDSRVDAHDDSSKKAAIYDGCNSPCVLHRLRRCSRPLLRAVPGFAGERVYSLVIVPRPPLRHFPSGTAVIMVSEGSPGFWG